MAQWRSQVLYRNAIAVAALAALLPLVSSACYSPKLKSCLSACESDSDCAPGHTCLEGENLCIDDDHPVQECRGTEEITAPLLDFWFGDPVVDATIYDRSGHQIALQVNSTSSDPLNDEQSVLSVARSNEWIAKPHLQLQSNYTVTSWLYVDSVDRDIPVFTEEFDSGDFRTLLGLDSAGRAEVRLSCQGSDDEAFRARSSVRVPRDAWVHVAVVVTGQWAFFYHDGKAVDAVPLTLPTVACDPADHYHFFYEQPNAGSVLMYQLRYHGSSLPSAEIERLAAAGRLESPAHCGDGLIDEGEECDGDSLCCDDQCSFLPDGSGCGAGATCQAGACVGDGLRTPGPALLYTFDQAGNTILAAEGPLDLPISTPGDQGSFAISGGAMQLEGRVVATAAVGQALDDCRDDGFTVEVTMNDGSPNESGPPRIVSLNEDPSSFGTTFDVGPDEGRYILRFTGGFSDDFGRPTMHTPKGDAQAVKNTHLAFSVDPTGPRRIYVDGVRRASLDTGPGIDEWDEERPFTIANVGSCTEAEQNCRDWEGTLYTVAVYCRPLSEIEIGNNASAELGALP